MFYGTCLSRAVGCACTGVTLDFGIPTDARPYKINLNFRVRVRLGWKPSFPHPPWERHHPLGSKAQMQRLNGGR